MKINIGGKDFDFTSEILMRHLRKIQPITQKMEDKEISELDFFVKIAVCLCESKNKDILENEIDNLDIAGVEKFTKDFEPILKKLGEFNQNVEKDKKK